MPKGYLIARVAVTDAEKYAGYVPLASAAIQKFGGRPVVRGGRCEIVEGEGRARNVVLEFDSFEQARAYYFSPEYQAAKAARAGAGTADMVIVEGP